MKTDSQRLKNYLDLPCSPIDSPLSSATWFGCGPLQFERFPCRRCFPCLSSSHRSSAAASSSSRGRRRLVNDARTFTADHTRTSLARRSDHLAHCVVIRHLNYPLGSTRKWQQRKSRPALIAECCHLANLIT